MTAAGAWRDAVGRVNRAPAMVIGVWALNVAVSVPLAFTVRAMLTEHLGSSLAADTAASGVNYEWMQQFADGATGLGATFRPTIIGFAAVLDNVSAFLDRTARPVAVVGAAAAYLILWAFVTGGIIDRYARNRATRAHQFFAISGVFFFRFLRLAAVMGIVYGWLLGSFHPWLFGRVYTRLIADVTSERTAFLTRLGLYLVFVAVLTACNIVFDYAKVRAVVEDRRSMIGAIVAGVRFVIRNSAAVAALYAADVAMFAIVVAAYAVVAPGAGGTGWSMWIGFAIGQAYVAARLWTKLLFWASETALFQGRLAHAGYVAAPLPTWPEAANIEVLGPTRIADC